MGDILMVFWKWLCDYSWYSKMWIRKRCVGIFRKIILEWGINMIKEIIKEKIFFFMESSCKCSFFMEEIVEGLGF